MGTESGVADVEIVYVSQKSNENDEHFFHAQANHKL